MKTIVREVKYSKSTTPLIIVEHCVRQPCRTYPNPVIRAGVQEAVDDELGVPLGIEAGGGDGGVIPRRDGDVGVRQGPRVHPEPGRDHVTLQREEVDGPVQRVVPRLRVVDTADVVVAFTLLVVVAWGE